MCSLLHGGQEKPRATGQSDVRPPGKQGMEGRLHSSPVISQLFGKVRDVWQNLFFFFFFFFFGKFLSEKRSFDSTEGSQNGGEDHDLR